MRVVTALIVMGLFLGSLWLGRGWLAMLVGIVGLVAVTEFYFSAQRVGFRPMVLLGILGTAAVLIAAWWGETNALLALAGTTGAALLGIILWYALMPRALPLENAGLTFLGVIWVGTMLAFVMPIARAPDWRILIGFVVVVNAGFDIGSYFVGRSLGKTALAPQLSPKKTIEGLAGGIALAAIVGVLMAVVFEELVPIDALILVVVITSFALVGDLSASFVKRALGLKDMGTVLPGHGGVIDRIDGLLMAVPAVFFALDLLGYL